MLQLEGSSQEGSGHQASSTLLLGAWQVASSELAQEPESSRMSGSHPSDQIHIGLAMHVLLAGPGDPPGPASAC